MNDSSQFLVGFDGIHSQSLCDLSLIVNPNKKKNVGQIQIGLAKREQKTRIAVVIRTIKIGNSLNDPMHVNPSLFHSLGFHCRAFHDRFWPFSFPFIVHICCPDRCDAVLDRQSARQIHKHL